MLREFFLKKRYLCEKNLKQLCGSLYLSFMFRILYHMGITLQYYFNRIIDTIAETKQNKTIKSQERKETMESLDLILKTVISSVWSQKELQL